VGLPLGKKMAMPDGDIHQGPEQMVVILDPVQVFPDDLI
jgi:hypothetical protein